MGKVQAGGLSVMVWGGAFSWHGMGTLVVLDATLTGERYLQLLGDHLHPFVMFKHLTTLLCIKMTTQADIGPLSSVPGSTSMQVRSND